MKSLKTEITSVLVADVVYDGSQHFHLVAERGDESPLDSETATRYQRDIMRTREAQSAQTALRELDQFVVPKTQDSACRGKGAEEPFWQGHIFRTQRRIDDGNKTGLLTYSKNSRVVL